MLSPPNAFVPGHSALVPRTRLSTSVGLRRPRTHRLPHTPIRANLLDGPTPSAAELPEDVKEMIDGHLAESTVVLYMKGVPAMPQCGFSQRATAILGILGARYKSHNVLADPELREGIKIYSQWPTIPQLYVDGEFVGGADIMEEMYHSGDLTRVLADADAI